VILAQITGEYEDRLKEKALTLVTKLPEQSIFLFADSRHIWRIFDNLMNNVCKYAQANTRVYLNAGQTKDEVVITLKNTSHYPLDLPASELMERFVRGDSSRSTEGNGLGLSIAQSLTELQKGKLMLTIDGDLFKVTLTFPVFYPN
jgi:signal transduction histidine kinase